MAIVRTGVAWSSLVCWLVILIGAGSSEVGARSAPVGQKRGSRACKVTGGRGPHVSRARGRGRASEGFSPACGSALPRLSFVTVA